MSMSLEQRVPTIESIEAGLASTGYISSRQIATALFLSVRLGKPILVEGPAGVGKTELAKATATFLDLPLIRMQCYEGLDESKALYEWKYGKQLLYTQILKDKLGEQLRDAADLDEALVRLDKVDDLFFSERFLEPRPLLRALREPIGCVLLVDEVDKADEEFESFLLEILSDYQVSIPELGTQTAKVIPIVLLTSNNTRDLGDAMKRRCLHLHIGYPDAVLEQRVLRARVPGLPETLRIAFVLRHRGRDCPRMTISELRDRLESRQDRLPATQGLLSNSEASVRQG